jgi:hypothetical protein
VAVAGLAADQVAVVVGGLGLHEVGAVVVPHQAVAQAPRETLVMALEKKTVDGVKSLFAWTNLSGPKNRGTRSASV